jgi:aryl-alcohol dehydrogenase-like predicted oxidoreductase
LAAVREVAAEVGSTPAAVSLAWLIARPGVCSVIFGARSIEQLDANLAATELTLSPEAMQRLDEASHVPPGYPYDFIARIQGRWG